MRAHIAIACLSLAPFGAWAADVPVPVPNPFVADAGPETIESGCPEGSGPAAVALGIAEAVLRDGGEAGMVVGGPMAAQMRAALGIVTAKPIAPASLIVVLPIRGPDGGTGQMWVLFEGACSPAVAVLPPPVAAAVWKQVGNIA